MKKILSVFLSVLIILANSPVSADVFGETDDRYFGFQMTIPLDTGRSGLFADKVEYSAMIVDQRDGIKDGVTFTWHANGAQTIGYLSPSTSFEIGQSKVSDYAIPVVSLTEDAGIRNNYNAGDTILYMVFGFAAFIKLAADASEDIFDCIIDKDKDCDDEDEE
jgi:hypothetical protein